jgi:membrane-bound acyltransferase YfiQ involved in biofilm formation
VNVWFVLLSNKLIGPLVIDSNLTGGTYKFFLRHELSGLLEHTIFMASGQMYSQCDGAESHYTQHVKQYLQDCFLDHWLGHGVPLAWPSRSPDPTLLDYDLRTT